MRARAILIASAFLVVALGGAAAWVAANDKDDSPTKLLSRSDDPSPMPPPATAPEATAPEATAPEATIPEAPTEQEEPPTTSEPAAPPPDSSGPAPKAKTHFEREPKGSAPRSKRSFTVPPAHEFSGEGNASLGTVDVKTTAILKWRTKGRFEVRFGRQSFPIIAPTQTGQLALPPFRFEQVRVVAAGPWRITISPQ